MIRKSSPVRQTLWAVLALIVTVLVMMPVLYIYVGAFFFDANGLFKGFTLGNFARAMSQMPLTQQLGNSIIVTICQTAGQIVTAFLAAYAIVFCNLRRPGMWMMVFLMSMMVPGETTLLSNYLNIANWGLMDTIPAIFLPFLVQGFTVFLFRQAFRSFPKELREASLIDGAGHLRFMVDVLLPIVKPTIIAATINAMVAAWNGYFWPLLVTNKPEHRTIQVGITQLSGTDGSNIGVVLAGAAIAVIPAMILTLMFNKSLRGMSVAGSIKYPLAAAVHATAADRGPIPIRTTQEKPTKPFFPAGGRRRPSGATRKETYHEEVNPAEGGRRRGPAHARPVRMRIHVGHQRRRQGRRADRHVLVLELRSGRGRHQPARLRVQRRPQGQDQGRGLLPGLLF